MYTLREDQRAAVDRVVGELSSGRSTLVVSPTGSGKSFILAESLRRLPGAVLSVPSVEIGLSVAKKIVPAIDVHQSASKIEKILASLSIYTVKKLHNLLLQGKINPPPFLLHDEAHHSVDNTHDVVHAACGFCPRAGLTATAYRGTPDETAKLRKAWGNPWVSLHLGDAVRRGIVARPSFSVWPLINDDEIKVSNGEFVIKAVDKAVEDCLPDLVKRIDNANMYDWEKHEWRRTTMIRVSSVQAGRAVLSALRAVKLPAVLITGEEVSGEDDEANRESRQQAFTRIVNREVCLVQVRVVGEGVDLPMRVLIDLAPTISPVLWMQAVGRITRPLPDGDSAPCYIATNHNLTRHAYLWEGLIPPAMIRDAQLAWGPNYKPSRRSLARALNLEGFGRFTVSPVPLADGSSASLYALQTPDGMNLYAVLLHPCMGEPWYFQKTNIADPSGKKEKFRLPSGHEVEYIKKLYGPWRQIEEIPSADGYVSVKPGHLTDGMTNYWRNASHKVGLDPKASVDARQFQALPILMNTRKRFSFATDPVEVLDYDPDDVDRSL